MFKYDFLIITVPDFRCCMIIESNAFLISKDLKHITSDGFSFARGGSNYSESLHGPSLEGYINTSLKQM